MSRFLLVSLTTETILQETTIYRRRQKLRALENGADLGGAYEAMLGRIKAQSGEKARLGMAVLMWVSHSRRPLQVDEICHAIAIRIGSNDLDADDIPAISTLLGCCQGLVSMDEGASTVRLIHFTLQEYLRAHPDLLGRAHATMAETCLTYLNFRHVKDPSTGPSPDLRGAPFLEYCSLYWGTHLQMGPSDRAKEFALDLLDQFDNHISANFLWKSIHRELPFYCDFRCGPFSALHCISYFGIAGLADTLVKINKRDVNQRDSAGMTPLMWAARYGHEEIVRLLLREKHIQPDLQDANSGRSAFSWAAGNGHEDVVRLFLGPGFVNPGSIDGWWGKARQEAGLLLGKRYVNPNSLSRFGRTPLLVAAGGGHKEVVKLLLGREDVNPDTPDEIHGQTPLSWAAKNGHEGIVKLLLGRRGVNPDNSDKHGRTPLSWAAGNGSEGAVELLLERKDVNPDTLDTRYGQTPLSWAAERGHVGVVNLLLGRKDVNPDSLDKSGRTPLSWAAVNGHERVVKLLLGREGANPRSFSESGPMALALATQKGHARVVELLRAQNP